MLCYYDPGNCISVFVPLNLRSQPAMPPGMPRYSLY